MVLRTRGDEQRQRVEWKDSKKEGRKKVIGSRQKCSSADSRRSAVWQEILLLKPIQILSCGFLIEDLFTAEILVENPDWILNPCPLNSSPCWQRYLKHSFRQTHNHSQTTAMSPMGRIAVQASSST